MTEIPSSSKRSGSASSTTRLTTRLGFVCAVQLLCTRAYFPKGTSQNQMAHCRFPDTRSVKTCSAREDTLKRFGPSNEDHPHRCLGSVPFTLQQIRTQVATFWIPGNGSTYTANCFRPQFGHWSISSRGFEWEELIPLCLS